jgi:hypothetical protein
VDAPPKEVEAWTVSPNAAPNRPARTRRSTDESYIVDLCDEILGTRALRHYRFPFLRGDPNEQGIRAYLRVDAYYPDIDLVVEYHERQHTEPHPWFDRRIVNKTTGETRGTQRKRYDRRRRTILPKHGIAVIVLDYSEFDYNSAKRLRRQVDTDRAVLRRRLADFLPAARSKKMRTTKACERAEIRAKRAERRSASGASENG